MVNVRVLLRRKWHIYLHAYVRCERRLSICCSIRHANKLRSFAILYSTFWYCLSTFELAVLSFSCGEKVFIFFHTFSPFFVLLFCFFLLFLSFLYIFSMWFAFNKPNWCFMITMCTKCGQMSEHVVECPNFTHFSLINMWTKCCANIWTRRLVESFLSVWIFEIVNWFCLCL